MSTRTLIEKLRYWDGIHTDALSKVVREAAAELERLHERLEDNYAWDSNGNRVAREPGTIPDGIACRDETIRGQDGVVERLRAELKRMTAPVGDAEVRSAISFLKRRDHLHEADLLQRLHAQAARYRWLRQNAGNGRCRYSFWDRERQKCVMGNEIDTAVDAARSEK